MAGKMRINLPLPEQKTCGDCESFSECFASGHTYSDFRVTCDYTPIRFKQYRGSRSDNLEQVELDKRI